MKDDSGGPGGGSGGGPGGHDPPHDAETKTVPYNIAGGAPSVLVSPSFLNAASAQASTVMLTRENPSVAMSKTDISTAITAALQTETGTEHPIVSISKYPRDIQIICVRFLHPISAQTMLNLNSVQIKNVQCAVSKYGQRLVQVELTRVPVHATVEEVVEVVKQLGTIKSVTRPPIQGYEDHKVLIAIETFDNVDLAKEQKSVFRPASFSGETYIVQYRCHGQVVVCTACRETGHMNGPKCPMKDRCLTCNEQGHMKRECPQRRGAHTFPEREEQDHTVQPRNQGPPPGAEQQPAPIMPGKPPAPPPPPADASALQSTGLPPLGGTTWGSFDPSVVSDIEMRRSKSPLDHRHRSSSSTRSIVSVERQNRLEKTIRGGMVHSEALREKMKEKKRRDKEAKMRDHNPGTGLMLQCLNVQSQDENKIPQLDGPISDPQSDGTSDDDFEQDTEAIEEENDELQYLCFGLDEYASDTEASIAEKKCAKTERLREQIQAAQQRKNELRRTSRDRCLKASTLRVPPELVGHRELDWEEYIRGLPNCCWPAQVSDMIALGLMAEDDPDPTVLTCLDCTRSWHMRTTEEQDNAIFEPPHVLCEVKQGLACLRGHSCA